jgi:hypothetical protein
MDANPMAVPAAPYLDVEALERKARSGARWFFWIAALSLVNTAIAHSGEDRTFLVGLTVTQVADAFARVFVEHGWPKATYYAVIGFDVLMAGLFAAAGVFAQRKVVWLFATAIVLYALDALLCIPFEAWPSLAFHGLALFYLWSGFTALRTLRAATAPPVGAPAAAAANRLVR